MIRTLINLPEDDKAWLEERAREEGVSMAEMVRRAVERLRADVGDGSAPATTEALLARTAGLRRGEDGLIVQKRLRAEWSRS